MPAGLIETPGSFVDPQCPVAWEHPLNRGLVAWWGGVPNSGWIRGSMVRDLVRGGKKPNDTTLGGATWKGTALFFDSTDTISCTVLSTILSAGFTLFFDLIPSVGAGTDSTLAYMTMYGGASENIGISFRHNNPAYAGACWMKGSGTYPVVTWGTKPSADVRCQVGMSWDGATISAYINGISQGTVANSTFGSVTSQTLAYGGDGASRQLGGTYISVKVYSRTMSATEHRGLVQQSKLGNPETLRWVGSKTYSFSQQVASTTVIPVLMNQYRSRWS